MKQITKLPQPPTTAEPQNFDDRADAFVGALPKFVTEANEVAAEAEQTLQTIQTLKEDADASKQAAQASAQAASEAETAAIQGANSAESSAQAAAQIKTQTQEIKQSAQEALAIIAAAAQSSAQAARQSEQAAEQTKIELQTATNTLEQMKSIVKDGFIDDTAQSETKTYSSKKIAELNETLKTDVTQKLDQTGKEIRTAAMSGAMPSAYESDLAMWDYMETSPVVANEQQLPTGQNNYALLSTLLFEGDINIWTYNHSVIPIAFEGSDEILPFRKGDAAAIYNIEKTITLIDGGKAYVYCQKDSNVYIFSAAKGMKGFSKNSQTPNVDPLQSFESKYLIYLDDLKKEAHVYVVDAAAETLKYAFKKKIDDDKFSAYGSAYVAFNYLKIGDFTFKITDTDLTLASEGEIYLPKQLGGEIKAPFHRSSPSGFIISGEYVYDVKSGKVLKSFMNLKFSGFLGRTDYLLIKNLSDEYYSLSYIYDVKYGVRCVRMPEGYYPVNVSLKDGYAYVLFVRADSRNPRFYIQSIIMVIKIPMKFLTGKNYKG
uniref:Uncharacterized protein n=1 Tax=Myoviridae sp. ctDvB7 TaxID=2825057 RepID=A0A8S5UEF3_9CAUD|nr:MAG TPA: hypothetical protein [Myoviridae sp. ctDvB7]